MVEITAVHVNMHQSLTSIGFHRAPRLWLPSGWLLAEHAAGDDGDDQDLGPAQARLPAHLHGHLRQPGQHVAAVPPAHQALALL